MAKTKTTKSKSSKATPKSQVNPRTPAALNELIHNEIARLAELHTIDRNTLEDFAAFVIANHKKKVSPPKPKPKPEPKPKPLTQAQLKAAIYQYFEVKTTAELKRSGKFKMATDGMDDLNLSVKETWEKLYREFIGILPGEDAQQGYGCINGINIFNYFRPWKVFGLDPKIATLEDIKKAYRDLSKVYHPDNAQTGDAQIFNRINTMYRSISAEA